MNNVDAQQDRQGQTGVYIFAKGSFYSPILNEQPFLVTALSQGREFFSSGGGQSLEMSGLVQGAHFQLPTLPGPKALPTMEHS